MPLSSAVIVLIIFLVIFFGCVVFFGAPYVPSHKKDVKRIFEYLGVDEKDLVVDLGSGDGVVLRAASATGARAIGIEINPILIGITRLLSLRDDRVSVMLQNIWMTQLPLETTLVYAFAVQRDERKLRSLLQREATRLNKPLRLICYGSPFRSIPAVDSNGAYHVYVFQPLQSKNA